MKEHNTLSGFDPTKPISSDNYPGMPACPGSVGGHHNYVDDGSTHDSDAYKCTLCGDRYKTYDSEMQ